MWKCQGPTSSLAHHLTCWGRTCTIQLMEVEDNIAFSNGMVCLPSMAEVGRTALVGKIGGPHHLNQEQEGGAHLSLNSTSVNTNAWPSWCASREMVFYYSYYSLTLARKISECCSSHKSSIIQLVNQDQEAQSFHTLNNTIATGLLLLWDYLKQKLLREYSYESIVSYL